jgi:phytoene synthase
MGDTEHTRIFRRGSRTYFNSSRFFPPEVRRDVGTLYGFVRTADDFVDAQPQKREEFLGFRREFEAALRGEERGNPIIRQFLDLMKRKRFAEDWVHAFLDSMQLDLEKSVYDTITETEHYIHGSAEVIGFMMASLMDLERESFPCAGMLGKAMQYINFIRDIQEDLELGRCYLPREEMVSQGLSSLKPEEAKRQAPAFRNFIRGQVKRYRGWQEEAERGFRFLPRAYLIPIKTASEMYAWTARRIEKDPLIVYRRKVKPSRARIVSAGIRNRLQAKTESS